MVAFWTWLAGTKAGRWAAGIAASLVALSALMLKIFAAGKTAEKRKITDDTLRAATSRKDVADAAGGLDAAVVRRRLRPWARNGARDGGKD